MGRLLSGIGAGLLLLLVASLGLRGSSVTQPVTASATGCKNCVIGSDLSLIGGIAGGYSGVGTASNPGLFSDGSQYQVMTPISLGPLAACNETATTNGSKITLSVEKNIVGIPAGLLTSSVSILSGDALACYQGNAPGHTFFDRGEEIEFDVAPLGTSPPQIGGFAASVYGAVIQPIGIGLNGVVGASTTTYTNWGVNGANATEANRGIAAPVGLTLRRMCVKTSTAQPASGALTITVRTDGTTATALVVTIPLSGAAGVRCNVTDTAVLTAGTWWSIELANAATASSANINYIGLEAISLGSTATAVLPWQTVGATVASTTKFANLYTFAATSVTETDHVAPVGRAGTLGNLYCVASNTPNNPLVITVRNNAVDTAMTVTVTGPGATAGTGTAVVAATDSLTLSFTAGAGIQTLLGLCSMSLT